MANSAVLEQLDSACERFVDVFTKYDRPPAYRYGALACTNGLKMRGGIKAARVFFHTPEEQQQEFEALQPGHAHGNPSAEVRFAAAANQPYIYNYDRDTGLVLAENHPVAAEVQPLSDEMKEALGESMATSKIYNYRSMALTVGGISRLLNNLEVIVANRR